MTVREILDAAAPWLKGRGVEPARLEAEVLLASVLGAGRLELYTGGDRPLADEEVARFRDLLRRRAKGEPSAYLTGKREFYGLDLEITTDVLVPRPETELLVDRARELAPGTLLDLCTGSGNIAVACAVWLPEARVTATDLSAAALALARRNAERHGVADRIRFLEGDLFDPVPQGERFDLIVSNPPYVADGGGPPHEPGMALHAGPRGLDVLARLIARAPDFLAAGGTLLAEIGEDQAQAVDALARERFGAVAVRPDLAGLPRVLEAVQREKS